MPPLPHSWAGEWSGLSAVVIGSGEVGFSVADTLQELGCQVVVVSDTPDADPEKILGVLGVAIVPDSGDDTVLPEGFSPDCAVLASPGARTHPIARAATESGAAVWSEVEFVSRVADRFGSRPRFVFLAGHRDGEPIARIAEAICRDAGVKAITVGSVGQTALDVIRDPAQWEVLLWPLGVGELADLANDSEPLRSPFISVALDKDQAVTSEAMDAVFFRTEFACLYSRAGGRSEKALEEAWVEEGARAIGIGLDSPGMSDLGVVEDIVCDRAFLDDRRNRALELTTLGELAGVGITSPEDLTRVLTASAIARALDISPEAIGEAIRHFGASES